MTKTKHTLVSAIFLAGLIAGTVDIGAAALINWLSPVVILHAIASGLVGNASFDGGPATALLGLLLQWAMAILIASIYIMATARGPAMRHRWRMTGAVAGVVIFIVMNYAVVPLSAAPFRPPLNLHALLTRFSPYGFAANLLAMIVFGLIIAFFARNIPRESKVARGV